MKYVILVSTILLALSTEAQDCTKQLLRNKPGTWKAGRQGSIVNVTAKDLTKERLVMAAVHKMIASNYNPTGCQVSYSMVYGKQLSAANSWIADPYHYSMYILPYLCDNNRADKSKYHAAISSATSVDITANVVYSLNDLYAANMPDDDFRGYLKLKQRPQKKDGAWFMGEEVVGDYGTDSEIRESRWLITYNDTLPFSSLSRKEYLLIQMKRLERSLKENPSEGQYIKKYMNNINEYLKQPDAELSKPAICMWNEEEKFEKFVEEGSKGSFVAVKPNIDYYHKKTGKSSPQFFSVVYTMSKGEPVFEDNIAAIKKAVNFETLKSMLGK